MNCLQIEGVMKSYSPYGSWRHQRKRLRLKIFAAIFLTVLAFSSLTFVSAMAADYDYVEVNSPFLRKIPTAVPIFKAVTSGAAEKTIATEASDLLSELLEFTGYFKMLSRSSFLSDPANPNIVSH